MSTATAPKATQALERELAQVCRRIDEAAKLSDRRVHLFIDLRSAGVTQARIGEVANMSDVGVVLAIKRHGERQDKVRAKVANARTDAERTAAEAELCSYCATGETAAAVG